MMKPPKLHEREINFHIKSHNIIRLNNFLEELHALVKKWQEKQIATKVENYVWINSHQYSH